MTAPKIFNSRKPVSMANALEFVASTPKASIVWKAYSSKLNHNLTGSYRCREDVEARIAEFGDETYSPEAFIHLPFRKFVNHFGERLDRGMSAYIRMIKV